MSGSRKVRKKSKRIQKISIRDRTLQCNMVCDVNKEIDMDPLNHPIKNALRTTSLEILEKNINGARVNKYNPDIFSYTVGEDPEPINQGSRGVCWIISTLGMMRRRVISTYYLKKEFNFSVNYLVFWDRLETSNEILEKIIELRYKSIYDGDLYEAYTDGLSEGGHYHTCRDLIKKYGVVPESIFNNSQKDVDPSHLNRVLKEKIQEFTARVQRLNHGCDVDLIEHEYRVKNEPGYIDKCKKMLPLSLKKCYELKDQYMKQITRIVIMMVGDPIYPTDRFDWVYSTAKPEKKKIMRNITPLDFYNNCKTHCNFDYDQFVTIINDPRPRHPYYRRDIKDKYDMGRLIRSIDENGVDENVIDEININLPMDEIRDLIIKQLDDGVPVFFSCNVGKYIDNDLNIMSMDTWSYGSSLNLPTVGTMSKADRLDYSNSGDCHAMTIVGYDEDCDNRSDDDCDNRSDDDEIIFNAKRRKVHNRGITSKEIDRIRKIVRFKVENSWGAIGKSKGYYLMDYRWLCEFGMEFVIDKKHLSKHQVDAMKSKPYKK
jgi:bleomycin hydrolase